MTLLLVALFCVNLWSWEWKTLRLSHFLIFAIPEIARSRQPHCAQTCTPTQTRNAVGPATFLAVASQMPFSLVGAYPPGTGGRWIKWEVQQESPRNSSPEPEYSNAAWHKLDIVLGNIIYFMQTSVHVACAQDSNAHQLLELQRSTLQHNFLRQQQHVQPWSEKYFFCVFNHAQLFWLLRTRDVGN